MSRRKIANPTRGCGHLKRGKGYIRGCIGSPNGVLPSFVRAEPFIPFREVGTDGEFTRGFLELNGVGFEAAAQDDLADFVPVYPGDTEHEAALENMVDRGLYDDIDDAPTTEYRRHLDRIDAKAAQGAEHFGEVGIRASNDLLMRAGKTHYPDPEDYIQETIEYGLSKAIPLSKRQEPPAIEPGLTRVWVVHPDIDGVGWGVLGFCYVQEVVFTEPADGKVPEYVQDYSRQGALDIVDIQPPEGADDDSPDSTIGDWLGSDDDQDLSAPDDDRVEQDIQRPDPWGQDVEDGVVDPGTDDPPAEPSTVVPNPDSDGPDAVGLDSALGSEFTYNDLKAIAARLDIGDDYNLGAHPSKDALTNGIAAHPSIESVAMAKAALKDQVGDFDA